MSYFENSLIYKVISGSWFLGWMVSTPGEHPQYYTYSYAYKLSNSLVRSLTVCLQRLGRFLLVQGKTSLIINNPIGFVGLLMFFYFGFDLSLNDYGLKRTLSEALLMVVGLLLPLVKSFPGIYQGSIIYRFLNWWAKTD